MGTGLNPVGRCKALEVGTSSLPLGKSNMAAHVPVSKTGGARTGVRIDTVAFLYGK